MIINKYLRILLINICIFICFPPAVSFLSGGSEPSEKIFKAAVLLVVVIDLILLIYSVNNKKTQRGIFNKIIFLMVIISFAVAPIIPLSSPSDILIFNEKTKNQKSEIAQITEVKLDDNLYLCIFKRNDRYCCSTIKKGILTYNVEHYIYSWDQEETDICALPHKGIMPYEDDFDIYYAALGDKTYRAYIDGEEMKTITADDLTLCYLITEEKDDSNENKAEFEVRNTKNELLYNITIAK